jgi:beta-N-acetylhexosaminidase
MADLSAAARPAPLIVGLSGPVLTPDERAFLREARPLGIILFARNIADEAQLVRLVAEAKEAAAAPLGFVDQEGGRVQRIRPPLAPRYPSAATIAALGGEAARRAAWLAGRLIGADIARFGLDSPCLPVADVPVPGAHDVIGDRAYGHDPETVAALAGAAAAGVLAAGCLPVAKHIPGHGRAVSDSHHELPTVTADRAALDADFAPFRALAGLPMAMTAHVRYTAIDAGRPATLSPAAIALIRDEIGFDGLLMSDDISMRALSGPVDADAAAALAAGCDVILHCNGDLREMAAIADALPPMTDDAARRLAAALAARRTPDDGALPALREEFAALTGVAAA